MKRIRIGKDIEIHWPILTNGEQVTLEGRDLHLVLHLPSCMETPLHFEPQGNIAVFTISGNMQKQLGAYRLTMWENKDKSGQTAVDYCDAFELVPTTCMEGGNDNNLTTETVNLDSSDLIVGLPGPSAYDLYKKHNPDAEISEEEYANAPIDAADAANEAAKAANEAVDKIGDINEALAGKVDKEEGKGLSSNDYTDDDKEKLDGLSNYDDTEVRAQLSEKASKEEVADAAEKTLSDANSHTDERIEETKSEIATGLLEFGQEAGKAISDGDATTLQSAQKYTDDAIDAIPTPDVSGQIEQHNTSPTAHPDIREILNTCVGLPEFNSKTYELTFTTIAGAKLIVDLPNEQMGLEYNEETRAIEFINADGSISSIPVSDFVKVYVGSIGPEIQIAVDGSEIRATLLNNTVSWDKLTLTLQEVIEGKADRTEIPTKVSELENDSEFVTAKEIDPELRKTSFEVVAHSDCTLEERVAQLESLLVRMLSGDVLIPELQVKKLGIWGDNNLVVTVEGATTGLEAGAWWLPSVDEVYLLMHDRVLTSADRESDPVNRTLSRLGKTTCYGSGYYPWTSCEYNSGNAFIYNGYAGYVGNSNKYNALAVRTVSAL